MTTNKINDEDLFRDLHNNARLKEAVQSLLHIVKNAEGDVILADTAEEKIAEELRRIGVVAVETWAEERVEEISSTCENEPSIRRAGKKNSTGIAR